MSEPAPYKTTIFDRHGPAAADYVKAWAYGLSVFGLAMGAFAFRGVMSVLTTGIAIALGAFAGGGSWWLAELTGRGVNEVMFSGSSTPYVEQYSYQQALVMQGKLDEALESFEEIIAAAPTNIDARLRAAELYARDKGNATRAAELFREIQRIPGLPVGRDVYVSNRLVDLLTGPLADSGRALVELRHLIERHPGSPAAVSAREALSRLKQGR